MLTIYRVLRDFNGGFGPQQVRTFLDNDKAQAYAASIRAINPKYVTISISQEIAHQ